MASAEHDDRRQAVTERARNVLVEASAGTGKTRLIVERIAALIAPHDGGVPLAIERIAALTFTRKAAGELRVRTRQQLLTQAAALPSDAPRAGLLRRALGAIDTAPIATIHGFADRLLRKYPAQAQLDPRYQLDDAADRLVDECVSSLLHGAETATLVDRMRGGPAAARAAEATSTILDAQRAGLRARSLETEFWTYHGLDGLVANFVRHRDVLADDPAPVELDRGAFEAATAEYLALVADVQGDSIGARWLRATGDLLRRARDEADPAAIFQVVVEWLERGPLGKASEPPRKKHEFAGDPRAWTAWQILIGEARKQPVRDRALRDDLLAPLRQWLAIRLARLRPVVLQVYDQVKARHQVVDHVDLLLRLRDLLRDDREIRAACQGLFDHILVDEFQDTDPLQAEIVVLLCERGSAAASWDHVTVGPGTLTVVGDPKQSIYRFRRADIATYRRAIAIVERSPHVAIRLSSSYRSAPSLVAWINTQFAGILGSAARAESLVPPGEVPYQPLTVGRPTGPALPIHAVPCSLLDAGDAAADRSLEAEVIARYVRWLVHHSAVEIVDPVTEIARPIGYGDVAVLAIATTQLRVLFDALDRDDVPYAAHGGTVFLADPLQVQFLLGLCALADRDDGVAIAALLRPPFFAVSLGDLARARDDDPEDRAAQARAIIRELRRDRFARGPGATARALLEQTGIGRTIALGPNASQRLSCLRELCFQVEARALADRLDFDATMEQLRDWIDHPPRLDRPPPVTAAAVRVMPVQQAKGLEFPVVVLWDGRAGWKERAVFEPWAVARDGRTWSIQLDGLRWSEPPGSDTATAERTMREHERRRVVYVAATRARDLLVIPQVGAPRADRILGTLLATPSPAVLTQPPHTPAAHAAWFDAAAPAPPATARVVTGRDRELQRAFAARAAAASRPRHTPIAFTDASEPHPWWGRRGRFGTRFGATVHLAIGLTWRAGQSPEQAVIQAASQTGLAAHLPAAAADVRRAVAALRALDLELASCALEYPISGLTARGELVAGYIDLVAARRDHLLVLDFKTDAPPVDLAGVLPNYVDQVRGYAEALRAALSPQAVRAGLLYTADGGIRWLSTGDHATT